MDFSNLAKERYSVRSFSDEKVSDTDLSVILEAGNLAPTACNRQPQRIIAVRSEEGLKKLKNCTDYTFDAPLALIVCYEADKCWVRPFDGKSSGDIDASIVATHMMLQAKEIGIGSTWVMYFKPDVLKKDFRLDENVVPVAILMMGHPSENCVPSHNHGKRKKIEETVISD
ncbi:MAG: nitroreductase family protein [Firmicutes bacterium]|nr:nitroreductase family protein [Candidatus Colimorpha enterica]